MPELSTNSGVAVLLGLMINLAAAPLQAADVTPLAEDEGYLLVRVNVSQRQRVSRLAFTIVDGDESVPLLRKDFLPAGPNAWMALVPAPEGRYFWSEYEAGFGNAIEESRDLDEVYRRSQPGSADDTFEIVADAINYIGDWTLREMSSSRRRLDPLITYEKTTMERSVAEYPQPVKRYPLYLSMMGKESISLDELAKIISSQSE